MTPYLRLTLIGRRLPDGRWIMERAEESDEQEAAFRRWCADTLFPQAVTRWLREIGEGA